MHSAPWGRPVVAQRSSVRPVDPMQHLYKLVSRSLAPYTGLPSVVPGSTSTATTVATTSTATTQPSTFSTADTVDGLEPPAPAAQRVSASGEAAAASPPAAIPAGKVIKLAQAVAYLPHPDKVHYGGEDAHFISGYGGGAMGVADGVGGWQESGVNPAEYSRTLMKLCKAYLEGSDVFEGDREARLSKTLVDPRAALKAAHNLTKVPGSATACVLQLDQERQQLVAVNLGDSGFMIVRNGAILVKSTSLQHYFDCPLQLGSFPEYVDATDTPEMADIYNVPLLPGDTIIMGSDGLWDNAYDSEILELLPVSPKDVQEAADKIAAMARAHASDNDYASPYTKEALVQGIDIPWWEKLMGAGFKGGRFQLKQLTGGKQDDITVLLAYVTAVDAPPPPQPQPIPGDGTDENPLPHGDYVVGGAAVATSEPAVAAAAPAVVPEAAATADVGSSSVPAAPVAVAAASDGGASATEQPVLAADAAKPAAEAVVPAATAPDAPAPPAPSTA